MVKESIHLHIGQAGCQVGAAAWELFCEEHQIGFDGRLNSKHEDDLAFESFFMQTPQHQFVPRAVFVDTDPSTRNTILYKGPRGRLYHPENIMAYKQDCHNNYFEGRSMASVFKIAEDVLERVRKTADHCSNLQGFMVYQSFGGGTGSGLGVEVLKELNDEFDRKTIIQPLIYPSNHLANCIVEPYNCVFATHYTRELCHLSYMMDNQACYELIRTHLKQPNPHFTDINRLLAQCISASTTSLRYDSMLNATFSEIVTNIVPLKGFRYPVLSLAPLSNPKQGAAHEFNSTQNIITELFEGRSLMADCGHHLKGNRYLAACVLLRGLERHQLSDRDTMKLQQTRPGFNTDALRTEHYDLEPDEYMAPIQANAAAKYLHHLVNPPATHRRPVRFVPWVGNLGFKVGVVGIPPCVPKSWEGLIAHSRRQGACIGNTTAVRQLFVRQYQKFCKLFYHQAYVWNFLEANGEIDCFYEAREGMLELINSYEEMLRKCTDDENADAGEEVSRLVNRTQLPELVAGTVVDDD
mmetsp:Transcript_16494/g.51597  ORF Transcript_16494/g.51597 Transcript_16494/m.51597 type:complete len:524 (-) Transcript_16494:9-1580(-)